MVPRAGPVSMPSSAVSNYPAEIANPTPEAVEFIRFCYRRRRLGWPELYDEMCAVAGRGLFRGMGPEELAEHGIGLGLFDLPALSSLAARVIDDHRDGAAGVRPSLAPSPA
jgi:hypothetical protein